jgi:hypothetical protein
MRFKDDKPLECEHCGEMIYAGDYALVWNNKCYNCVIPEESPAHKPGLLHTLCVGIEEELIEDGVPFDDFKKYYINDYHFERVD